MQTAPREDTLASLLSFQRRRDQALLSGLNGLDLSALTGVTLGRVSQLWYRAAITAAAALLILVIALAGFRSAYDDRVYPAVSVAGVPLGGLTEVEARAAIEERAASLEQGFVRFSYAGRTWTPTLRELGVSIDTETALRQAYAVGREDGAWERMGAVSRLARDDTQVGLSINLDYPTLSTWFDQVDKDLGLKPHDAYLVIEGRSVTIEPEVDGTILDRDTAYRQVSTALSTLNGFDAPLPVIAWRAKVRADDLNAAKMDVEEALSRNQKVEFEGRSWTLKAEELGPFIVQTVSTDPDLTGAAAVTIGLDETKFAAWLNEKFAAKINREPVDAEVGWNEGPVALTESQNGYKLRAKSLAREIAASMFDDHDKVEIPVSVLPPAVDSNNLGSLGITQEVARTSSDYTGSSPERSINIGVGTNLLNGTLVPPHGTFSFNHAIGEITAEKGYVEAKVISGENIDRDVGGGICQVSTAVFRVALLAGVPITEWHPHRFRLPFYERDGWGPGYDASILQPEGNPFAPGNDFQFQNPSDSWLLIESWADGWTLVIVIYGPDLGRTVAIGEPVYGELEPPSGPQELIDDEVAPGTYEHRELAAWGQRITFEREIYDANGELIESEEFTTYFPSHGHVFYVHPDTTGISPASTGEGVPPTPDPPEIPG